MEQMGQPMPEPTIPTTAEVFEKKTSSLGQKIASLFSFENPGKSLVFIIFGALALGGIGFGGWWGYSQMTGKEMTAPSFTIISDSLKDDDKKESALITNPINGLKYTSGEARAWQQRRPMAVMVNNHADARPQKGLSQADLIYEAVAEGGISRFLAIFHSKLPPTVGPVRSARVYYIDWAKEYNAWYAHWGSAQTPNEANAFARMQSIFVSSIESAAACSYDDSLARDLEHTLYCDTEELYTTGYDLYPDQSKEFGNLESWVFKDEKIAPSELLADKAAIISFDFWTPNDYSVEWQYDETTNKYNRFQNSEQQFDDLNKEPLQASNIIISFMRERALNDEKDHIVYDDIGTGDALVFLDGRVIKANWKRLAYTDRTVFSDKATGKEIEFNRGQVWIEVVPDRNEDTVTYQ